MIRQFLTFTHDRWANLHGFLRLIIGLILLAIISLGIVRPALHCVRKWRVERNLSAAKAAVKDVRMVEARDRSLSVLQAGDPRIDALRIFEKSTASLRDPRHGQAARALLTHPDGTDEDRLAGFRGLADKVALGLVGQAWVALPDHCHTDPRFVLNFSDRLIADGCFSEAAGILAALPKSAIDDAVTQRLVRVLVASRKPQDLDQALRLIVEGFPEHEADASSWLDLLESIPSPALQNPFLRPLRAKLINRSGADQQRAEFMVVRMDYATQWDHRSQFINQTIQRWHERNPLLLAQWLDKEGFHHRLSDQFQPAILDSYPALLPYLLNATIRTGDWERLLQLIDHQQDLLSPHADLAYRAVAIAKTIPQTKPRTDAWNLAVQQAMASPDPNALLELHRIATNAGMPDQADLAMIEAIRAARGPLPLYRELKDLMGRLVARERENLLIEICANYLLYEPGNPVLLTQYAYLACMNGLLASEDVLRAMVPMAAAFPSELPMQIVIMAAHLADGNPKAADEILKPLSLETNQLAPGYRAIVTATKVLTGKIQKEDTTVSQFPRTDLLPSERRKFNEWIRQAES